MPLQPTPHLYALVPCAGVGERAGTAGPKQYAALGESTVVGHTLKALQGVRRLQAVLVVLSPLDVVFEDQVPEFSGWVARCGGATRAQTVAHGLDELTQRGAQAHDWVLVHDAARCLVRPEWVNALIDACMDDAVGGLLALPVADTLKEERAGRVAATVNRAGKWQAQTPQMFRLGCCAKPCGRPGRTLPTRPAPSRHKVCRRCWCGGRWRISSSRTPPTLNSPPDC